MRVLKKGTSNTKSLGYTSLLLPILENGAACWDLYSECQINTLERVQKKAARFANHTSGSVWEALAHRAFAPSSERTSENGHGKIQGSGYKDQRYLSKNDHDRKIGARKERTDVGK